MVRWAPRCIQIDINAIAHSQCNTNSSKGASFFQYGLDDCSERVAVIQLSKVATQCKHGGNDAFGLVTLLDFLEFNYIRQGKTTCVRMCPTLRSKLIYLRDQVLPSTPVVPTFWLPIVPLHLAQWSKRSDKASQVRLSQAGEAACVMHSSSDEPHRQAMDPDLENESFSHVSTLATTIVT